MGYAYCSFDEGVMCLNDIKVQDDVILPPQNLLYAFWRIAVKPKPVDLRNHGLGTAMLQNVIDEARARDAKYITGFVTPDDLKNTPRLLAWYSKHGFIILEQSREIEGKWRKIILPLQLDNNVRNMLSQ